MPIILGGKALKKFDMKAKARPRNKSGDIIMEDKGLQKDME